MLNTIIHKFVKLCYEKEVSEIVVGDASEIRENNDKNAKIKENYTSSVCPRCGSKGKRITRGSFYCPKCNQIMNADVVGCLNIAKKCKA